MRCLWLIALPMLLAFPGLAQLSGEWSAELSLLPSPPNLDSSSFSLTYGTSAWEFTSITDFKSPWGGIWQEFDGTSSLGPASLKGSVLFGPQLPDFLYAELIANTALGEAELGLYTAILGSAVGGYIGGFGPSAGAALKLVSSFVNGAELTLSLGFGATLPPDGFTIYHVSGAEKTFVTDPRPGGFRLTQLMVSLSGLGFCCGITCDVEFSFLKETGFDYLKLTLHDLFPLCCGISFEASVTFTTTGKSISVGPKLAGFGEGCIEVYGDVERTGGDGRSLSLAGIRIDGWKIRCDFSSCQWLELVSFLSPEHAADYGYDVFEGDEFEYVKLHFCGPACCGGKWELSSTVFFGGGTLFNISRFVIESSLPLMDSLTVGFKLGGQDKLAINWTFQF